MHVPIWKRKRRVWARRRSPILAVVSAGLSVVVFLVAILCCVLPLPLNLLGFMLFAVAGRLMIVSRKRNALDAFEVLAQDHRSPVLLLRSFDDDEKKSGRYTRWPESIEELLISELSSVGPVIAIGRPGEKLPALGAARFYTTDDAWQDEVQRRLSNAGLCVFLAGTSKGLNWEIKQAVACMDPTRLLFCLPFPYRQDSLLLERVSRIPLRLRRAFNAKASHREDAYRRFCESVSTILPAMLPDQVDDGYFLYFESDWTPHLLSPSTTKNGTTFRRDEYRNAHLASLLHRLKTAFWQVRPKSQLEHFYDGFKNIGILLLLTAAAGAICLLYVWISDFF